MLYGRVRSELVSQGQHIEELVEKRSLEGRVFT